MRVIINQKSDYEYMRVAGKIAAEVLDYITDYVQIGVTTLELNDLCHNKIIELGCICAPLNYRGFPKSICTSINHVVCHGIPGDTKLKNGDIVNIDVTVITKDGWYGDSSRMYFVGDVSIKAKRLTHVTYEAMMRGICEVKPGATLGDIGYAIQQYVESNGFSVVRDYCGHGIGKFFHGAPNILHYGKKGEGMVLEPGMFFTIEPMVNIGGYETKLNSFDGWTVTTKDRSLSAQFEHSIAVTDDSYEIFTSSPSGLDYPPYKK